MFFKYKNAFVFLNICQWINVQSRIYKKEINEIELINNKL